VLNFCRNCVNNCEDDNNHHDDGDDGDDGDNDNDDNDDNNGNDDDYLLGHVISYNVLTSFLLKISSF